MLWRVSFLIVCACTWLFPALYKESKILTSLFPYKDQHFLTKQDAFPYSLNPTSWLSLFFLKIQLVFPYTAFLIHENACSIAVLSFMWCLFKIGQCGQYSPCGTYKRVLSIAVLSFLWCLQNQKMWAMQPIWVLKKVVKHFPRKAAMATLTHFE